MCDNDETSSDKLKRAFSVNTKMYNLEYLAVVGPEPYQKDTVQSEFVEGQ